MRSKRSSRKRRYRACGREWVRLHSELLVRALPSDRLVSGPSPLMEQRCRSPVVAAAELATYDQCKQLLISHGLMQDNVITHFTASVVAGFAATAASSPIGTVHSARWLGTGWAWK